MWNIQETPLVAISSNHSVWIPLLLYTVPLLLVRNVKYIISWCLYDIQGNDILWYVLFRVVSSICYSE
jgi:hypothetical protein